jgi:hypothetical protein
MSWSRYHYRRRAHAQCVRRRKHLTHSIHDGPSDHHDSDDSNDDDDDDEGNNGGTEEDGRRP